MIYVVLNREALVMASCLSNRHRGILWKEVFVLMEAFFFRSILHLYHILFALLDVQDSFSSIHRARLSIYSRRPFFLKLDCIHKCSLSGLSDASIGKRRTGNSMDNKLGGDASSPQPSTFPLLLAGPVHLRRDVWIQSFSQES